MPDVVITQIGNLTADPELRFTPSGAAVAQFSVASTPRIYDKQSGEWRDGTTTFLRASVWHEWAEGAAEVLRKGDSVVVVGKLEQRSFETREGEKRTVFEVKADFVGKSVKARKQRDQGAGQPATDPWGNQVADAAAPF